MEIKRRIVFMKCKKITGIILIASLLFTGCSKDAHVDVTSAPSVSETITETTLNSETLASTSETLGKFEFNPHVYSAQLAKSVPQEHWDAFYNLCDALRKGENTFNCSSEEAYKWCTDATVLCCMFPAAGLKIEAKSEDGSKAFENGTGKITYKMPKEDWLKRQSDFESMILDIINSNVETDDTDYEKALKLYLYIAYNYDYENKVVEVDNYVYKTFTKKIGQCINFAAVYAYLLMQVGVDALACGTHEGTDHAWTYVTINGKGYHIDTTWALKSCYPGMEYIYLDYFMMSDEERNSDGCLISGLVVDTLPGYWVSNSTVSYAATDNTYNIRKYCTFLSLDEEKKIVRYSTEDNEIREFKYDI